MTKGTQTRELILARAEQLAAREGIRGVTIGALAVALGMSKSGLFAHFGSKEALQLQVLRRAARRFQAVVVVPARAAEPGEAHLRALFERWLVWDRDPAAPDGCLFTLLSLELRALPGPLRDFVVEAQRSWRALVAQAARTAADAGELRSDLDPEQFAFSVQALLLGYHLTDRLLGDARAERRAHDAFDELLAAAKRPRAPRPA